MAEVYRWAPKTVSRIAGVQAAVANEGQQIAARARAALKGHRDTGASRITVERRRPDYLVHLVDENAIHIELGGIRRDGTVIPGLFILTHAAYRG